MNTLLGGSLFGPHAVGYLNWGMSLSATCSQPLVQIIGRVCFPAFSRLHDQVEERSAMLVTSLRLVNSATFPILMLLPVLGPALVTCVFGEPWRPGLVALGLPQDSLDSFAWEFRQGMAARAQALGDVGESAPEHWEWPLGTPDVHVVITAVAPDTETLESVLDRARRAYREVSGVTAVWRQDCHALPTEMISARIEEAIRDADAQGIGRKDLTPFLLKRIFELTEGKSLTANIALVENNARVAAEIAVALSKLDT